MVRNLDVQEDPSYLQESTVNQLRTFSLNREAFIMVPMPTLIISAIAELLTQSFFGEKLYQGKQTPSEMMGPCIMILIKGKVKGIEVQRLS